MALAEIDEDVYAGEALRHQAQIGDPRQHEQLIGMAEALSLPETQLWLAHNTPQGRKLAPATRYPQPKWEPDGGWKVRSEEHTSELQSLMRNAYAVVCLT